jgi:hypothetical protein
MNLTLNESGTPNNVSDDVIRINQAYVETVAGQGITVAAVPEPKSVLAVGVACVGFAAWRRYRGGRSRNTREP